MSQFPNITVPEGSSCNITGVIRTHKGGTAIGSGNITTATMKLNNLATGAVIRAAGNIAGDIDALGNLDTVVTGAENKMYDETRKYEYHVATIAITGTDAGGQVVNIVDSIYLKITNNQFQVST